MSTPAAPSHSTSIRSIGRTPPRTSKADTAPNSSTGASTRIAIRLRVLPRNARRPTRRQDRRSPPDRDGKARFQPPEDGRGNEAGDVSAGAEDIFDKAGGNMRVIDRR